MRNRDRAFQKNKTFGFLMPIKNSNSDGIFKMSSDSLEKYKSNLYTLIFTGIGERTMMPTFGTKISQLLFENFDDDLYSSIKTEIVSAASRWIPEIRIDSIYFGNIENSVENNVIEMKINFSLRTYSAIQDFIEIEMGL